MAADPVDVPDESEEMDEAPPTAWEICAFLGDDVRVWTLHELYERGPQSLEDLSWRVADHLDEDHENIRVALHHTHLPRFADLQVVRWTPGDDQIDLGPHADRVYRFLCAGEAAIGEAKTVVDGGSR